MKPLVLSGSRRGVCGPDVRDALNSRFRPSTGRPGKPDSHTILGPDGQMDPFILEEHPESGPLALAVTGLAMLV